jgi:PhnB protein
MPALPKSHPLVPHLIVDGAARAIDFYVRGLGAVEVYRLDEPNGRVAHAELTLEGAPFMLADEYPDMNRVGPQRHTGVSSVLTVYVQDVDARIAQAVAAGAIAERPIQDEFYGDRVGWICDPFGHRWALHTPLEDVNAETVQQRYTDLMRADPK